MINFDIWIILGILAIVLLLYYWFGPNAVWGGFTIGIIVGIVVGIYSLFQGNEFSWLFLGKSAILGTLIGFLAELLGEIGNYLFS